MTSIFRFLLTVEFLFIILFWFIIFFFFIFCIFRNISCTLYHCERTYFLNIYDICIHIIKKSLVIFFIFIISYVIIICIYILIY